MAEEQKYLDLLRDVLENGHPRPDRTGTGTLSVFGRQIRMDISKHPALLTTKQMAWKSCIRELLWFCRGDTNVKHLQAEGVRIWDGNSTRAFLDARGLTDLPEGDIGPGYGFQWRHFGAPYVTCEHPPLQEGPLAGVDQLSEIVRLLRNDPYSRRIFMSAWNAADLDRMALPPCHVSVQFYVDARDRGLSCHVYQRSVDCFLGLPFNLFSYSVLTYILAKKADLVPKELVLSTGDTHIYANHLDAVREQLSRSATAHPPPTLVLSDRIRDTDWSELTLEEDFQLVDYTYDAPIKAPMSV